MKPTLQFRRLEHSEGLPLPSYQTAGSAGMDLSAANLSDAPIVIRPHGRILIPTGLQCAVPMGYEAQIRPRSGMAARHGITVLNTPGTIDSDYRGELMVLLGNLSDQPFTVERGMRIAQMVIAPIMQVSILETVELNSTARGDGGFGSTGI